LNKFKSYGAFMEKAILLIKNLTQLQDLLSLNSGIPLLKIIKYVSSGVKDLKIKVAHFSIVFQAVKLQKLKYILTN